MSEVERSRVRPATPISEFSIGWVTRASTSSGERPGASVRMVTVGLVRSGRTSTGSSLPVLNPISQDQQHRQRMIARLRSDHRMRWFNMDQ